MQKKYFILVFLFMLVLVPAAASLQKISSGAPVFIGEQNLDISSGLQGCRVIGWWENGTAMSGPPARNVTIIKSLDDSDIAFRYSIDPGIYTGYAGPWYCTDKKPPRAVFTVIRPELSIRFWDLDKDEDISGRTVPLTTNITYRLETNLYQALQYRYRPDITPLDSFFTVTLTDPWGRELQSLYSGSYGKTGTLIIPFDKKPYISSSPYFWKEGGTWDLESRNAQGEFVYQPGTYTITVRQNLNRMDAAYPGSEKREGLLEASATVTLVKPEPSAAASTPSVTQSGTVAPHQSQTPSLPLTGETVPQPVTPVRTKTTYSPLPVWILPLALCIAALALAGKRR